MPRILFDEPQQATLPQLADLNATPQVHSVILDHRLYM
jgi:hypothetical protein